MSLRALTYNRKALYTSHRLEPDCINQRFQWKHGFVKGLFITRAQKFGFNRCYGVLSMNAQAERDHFSKFKHVKDNITTVKILMKIKALHCKQL